jgi:hypothetical protein
MRKVAVEGPSLTLASPPGRGIVSRMKSHETNTKKLTWPKRRHRRLGTLSTPHRRRRRPHPVALRLPLVPAIHPASSCSQRRRRVILVTCRCGRRAPRRPHLVLVVLVIVLVGCCFHSSLATVWVLVVVSSSLVIGCEHPHTTLQTVARSGGCGCLDLAPIPVGWGGRVGVAKVVIVDSIHT